MANHYFPKLHPWRIDYPHARRIQATLREQVVLRNVIGKIKTVAGVDVGFEDNNSIARGAVAVLSYPGLEKVEHAIARRRVHFPYVPGYLSFREIPSLLAALAKLDRLPDLILCDGQGYAHPRRFGLACHLGVITGIPTIGVAKTRLIGTHEEIGLEKGAWKFLIHREETIGIALRTRNDTKPVFVSCGHKISLATAHELTLNCCTKYRLPETTRAAHGLASVPRRKSCDIQSPPKPRGQGAARR